MAYIRQAVEERMARDEGKGMQPGYTHLRPTPILVTIGMAYGRTDKKGVHVRRRSVRPSAGLGPSLFVSCAIPRNEVVWGTICVALKTK